MNRFPPQLAIILLSIFCMCLLSACATTGTDNPIRYSADGSTDYPVRIIAKQPVKQGETDAIDNPGNVPVIETRSSGKTRDALAGAARGTTECGLHSVGAGPYAPFIFVPCAIIAAPVMAVVGAWQGAPQADMDALDAVTRYSTGVATHSGLAVSAHAYLTSLTTQPVSLTIEPQAAGGTLFELELLKIRFVGSGKLDEPLCLHMLARGRKLDAVTGDVVREFTYDRDIVCQIASTWLEDEGSRFIPALEQGQRMLAERLVDELYLIYRPARPTPGDDSASRPVPAYVLAPRSPPAPERYLDLRTMTKKAKHVLGMGGMHFVDVDNLKPTMSWEKFPRAFDMSTGEISDVSYDLRLFTSRLNALGAAVPADLLHEVTGVTVEQHSVTAPLAACTRYFWTVRARFRLNGLPRVTEWSGAYMTAGGEVDPSHVYFFPIRTPAAAELPDCWR